MLQPRPWGVWPQIFDQRRLRQLIKGERGATVVEFALVIGPFLTLMFGIFEIMLTFFASVALDHAAQDIARSIRTGNIDQTITREKFEALICREVAVLPECSSRVAVTAQSMADFTSASFESPFNEDGDYAPGELPFVIGGADDVVVMQVFFDWPVTTPLLGKLLSNTEAGDQRIITVSVAMKNEPFDGD